MRRKHMLALIVAVAAWVPAAAAQVKRPTTDTAKIAKKARRAAKYDSAAQTPYTSAPLFARADPVAITFTANLGRLRGDRGDDPPYRWAQITYTGEDGKQATIPLKVKTRGIWRRKNCDIPPIRLNFSKGDVKHTLFAHQDKLKLVNYCKDRDDYEQYVLSEFQVYRVYNVLTPFSHLVRLARVTYADSGSNKVTATRYGFILEDEREMAVRNHAMVRNVKGANPGDFMQAQDALLGVYQFLIGNTDFAESALHNVEVLWADTAFVPVAHDFDFAGAVNASYATADPRLPIKTVRERVFRGYCVPDSVLRSTFALFDAKKSAIYALYHDKVGALLSPDNVKSTLGYYDDFYAVIDNPGQAKRQILGACLGHK